MTELTATPLTVVVDPAAASAEGFSKFRYEKNEFEILVARFPKGIWSVVNPFLLLGTADADERGTVTLRLRPGEVFQAGLTDGSVPGPLEDMPSSVSHYIRVSCVWKQAKKTPLITDHTFGVGGTVGGTWITARVATKESTQIVYEQVSMEKPAIDPSGLPFMKNPIGTRVSYTRSSDGLIHDSEYTGLLPGQPHFYLVVVMDNQGRWDWDVFEVTTKQRKFTVEFQGIRVFNDGDWATTGEVGITFSIGHRVTRDFQSIQDFSWTENNFDDWGEAENGPRPYAIPFVRQGPFESVGWDTSTVWVWSNGEEDDSLGKDRAFGARALIFPEGRNRETVHNQAITFNCFPSNGGSLNYNVDVVFSVEYAV